MLILKWWSQVSGLESFLPNVKAAVSLGQTGDISATLSAWYKSELGATGAEKIKNDF